MSFSSGVKEELMGHVSQARHCQLAELAAILYYCGNIEHTDGQGVRIRLQTENQSVIRKCFTLLKKTFNIDTDIVGKEDGDGGKARSYCIFVDEITEVRRILQSVKLLDNEGNLNYDGRVSPLLLKSTCCQRAFLRGAYLTVGSMSDPEKSYHMEFVCTSLMQAEQLQQIILGFEVEAKIVQRKKYHVVYLKEGSGIVDMLNIIEAHVALMELENLRILKEMRNSINRKVNCEAANITKTVNASTKQTEDIILIRDTCGLQSLPGNLRQMAEVRLEYPDATLKELGQLLEPAVGKSGVNHRLRKLSEIADRIRL